jgi:hypothetical protein
MQIKIVDASEITSNTLRAADYMDRRRAQTVYAFNTFFGRRPKDREVKFPCDTCSTVDECNMAFNMFSANGKCIVTEGNKDV